MRISQLAMLGFLIFGVLLISVLWRYKRITVTGFCLLFFLAGIWRYQTFEAQSINSELSWLNNKEEIISLVGIVIAEPDIRGKSVGLIIQPEDIENYEEGSDSVNGKILVTASLYPEYQYGDKLRITGKLESPPIFGHSAELSRSQSFNYPSVAKDEEERTFFDYRNYLKKDGIYSVMSWPKIEPLERGNYQYPISIIYANVLNFKKKFQEVASAFISPPQEGLLEALVFGDENNISKEWKDKLNLTGTRHIAAVSGMNITIIASLILVFLLSLGLWRQQAFYLAALLLALYILMIGAPASAVRAGIMAGIVLAAQYFGRLSSASRAVIFAAFLMLLINPLLLRLDIGFQLSFLAILGIIYWQPTITSFLKYLPNPKIFPLRATLAATLSAQIFTIPILIYNFGFISLLSPVANILIVPFLAPVTILIFLFGFTGMVFQPLGIIFSVPVWFSLTYIVKVIDFFSKIPYAALHLANVHWGFLLISYFILGFIFWRLQKSQKLKFLKY